MLREIKPIVPFSSADEAILYIEFSPYTNGKNKDQLGQKYNEIISTKDFLINFQKTIKDFSSHNNKEHVLEIKVLDTNQSELKKITNYQNLAPLLNEDLIVLDLASFLYVEQYNTKYYYQDNYLFTTTRFTVWFNQ